MICFETIANIQCWTNPNKKVDHKKYIEGEVDLLCHISRPLLALLDTLTRSFATIRIEIEKKLTFIEFKMYTHINWFNYLDASMK